MLQNLTGWHALVILAIVLLVFGSSKLPQLARSVGQSVRILKDEVHDDSTIQQPSAAATPVAADDRPVATSASVDPVTGLRAS